MSDKVKVARYRNTSYVVNYTAGGSLRAYTWNGSRGKKVDTKEIPREVVEWLAMNSRAFDEGELVIIKDKEKEDEAADDVEDGILDKESYENNSHTAEEIETMLKTGNAGTLKNKLKDITVEEEKHFVISVAEKMDLPNSKLKYLAEWMGVPNNDPSLLFE